MVGVDNVPRDLGVTHRVPTAIPMVLPDLRSSDQFWLARREFLDASGYRLRPKFYPDYVPSPNNSYHFERATHVRHTIMDATSISDQRPVMLKAVSRRLHHTKNHCIPIFDVLQDPYDDDKQIIVMPQLIDVEEPIFQTVGEVIDFFRQVFEGIQFMHENFVAHRDCWGPNIAQDPTLLFPFGVHPVYTFRDPTNRHSAYYITRTECWPRYFLLDFGLSRRYDPSHGPPFEPVIRGGDQSPPEHRKLPLFCNPFPTDIYFLGNVLKENFLFSRWVNGKRVRMSSLRFLEPLTIEMTQQDPALRPTIGEVIERFDKLCTPLTEWHLRRPGQKTIRRIPPIPPYHPRTDTTPLSPSLREFYTQIPASSVVQQEKIEAGPGLKADFTGSESKSIAVESDG